MIKESDGCCLILPPPVECPRCKKQGFVAIAHNEYYEGDVETSKKIYYEMFYKCVACDHRLENMSSTELHIWNSYPSDKQAWPKSMHHKQIRGRVK